MDERFIAAVDLGTSKIAVTVAQTGSKGVQMIYYRETPSDGIRNSYVLNPQKAARAVGGALRQAEEELNIKIHQVITGLPRYEVAQINAKAELERSDPDSSITLEEIDFLKTNAIDTYPLPDPDKQMIYGVVAQSFTTEECMNARESETEGMVSDRIEGNFKVFVGRRRYSDNVDRVMNLVGVAVARKCFLPEITAKAVLSEEERENGVALIEIGAGATSVSIYHNDILRYYASIPFGGRSITSDIRLECGTSERLAENIKLAYGACMPEKLLNLRDKIIQITNNESGSCKQLSVKYLSEVITCRIKEIVDACLYKIQESGLMSVLRSGIVLTGGGAAMPNLATYVKELSGYNVRIGYPRQKFSFTDCPGICDTSAAVSVAMIMAMKDDRYINCLSEPPVRKEEATEEEPPMITVTDVPDIIPEPVPAEAEEDKAPEKKEEPKEKKEKKPKKPLIVWKTPGFAQKIGSVVGKLIDDTYDRMDE